MSEKKSWGSTVAGWFVVQDQPSAGAAPPPEAELTPPPPPPELNVFNAPPPPAPGGVVDFDQVYEAAGVDAEERQRVTRTLDLLNSLPPGTDDAMKKQIVMASLRAFGVPIEQIIEAAAQEIQALEAYIRNGAADSDKVASEAEKRIKQYEEEIVKLRTVMRDRVDEQQAVTRRCNDKKLEVQKVLEFFGQDAVARVVKDSPKLHEPA
jgi:SpoVK/Ycf46/Vps4 family AAA+-type ATPase